VARRSMRAAEASTRLLVSRQASKMRAAVFIVSPISAISLLKDPSSPTATGPQCRPARKSGTTPNSRCGALRGDPVEGGEGGVDARRRIRAGREVPCCDHLVADILVNSAARFRDSERHVADKAVEQAEIAQFAEALGDGGRGAHVDEQERALLNPGVMIPPGGEGEQHARAEEVVDAEEKSHANHRHHRNDDVDGPDFRKASPRCFIDNDDDEYDDADVKDRTQREIGQKRQRVDEAAGIASQHESFERNEAGRAQGAGQTAAHRRPVPGPGVEGPDQETQYDARQEESEGSTDSTSRRL